MKPIGKYIAAKLIDEEVQTQSGLILSGEDVDQFRYKKAVVLEVGTDVTAIDNGDTIYFDKAQSYTMIINNEQVTILREIDVVVVL